ncbi:MAG: hypothetical protein ABJB86_23500 [Bacteroidota bacterium]
MSATSLFSFAASAVLCIYFPEGFHFFTILNAEHPARLQKQPFGQPLQNSPLKYKHASKWLHIYYPLAKHLAPALLLVSIAAGGACVLAVTC